MAFCLGDEGESGERKGDDHNGDHPEELQVSMTVIKGSGAVTCPSPCGLLASCSDEAEETSNDETSDIGQCATETEQG